MDVYLTIGIHSAVLLNLAFLQLLPSRTNDTMRTLGPLCLQPLLQQRIMHVSSKNRQDRNGRLSGPQRLQMIDVTRCNQISKEMVQWLRMYVALVKCKPAKDVW